MRRKARATTTPTTTAKTNDGVCFSLLSSSNSPGAVGCGTAIVPLSLSFVNGRAGAETEEERRAGTVRWRCGGRARATAAAANFGDGAFAKEEDADEHDDDAVACEQALIVILWSSLSIQKRKSGKSRRSEEGRFPPP